MRILRFKIAEKGKWAYILWPWTTPEAFLYEALHHGAQYKLRRPLMINRLTGIEFTFAGGTHGDCDSGVFFGVTPWGPHIWRRFSANASHSMTQHGLDGIPNKLIEEAREYEPGEPVGQVEFQFHVSTAGQGKFEMTFYDWDAYFISGRNGHISQMAISYKIK